MMNWLAQLTAEVSRCLIGIRILNGFGSPVAGKVLTMSRCIFPEHIPDAPSFEIRCKLGTFSSSPDFPSSYAASISCIPTAASAWHSWGLYVPQPHLGVNMFAVTLGISVEPRACFFGRPTGLFRSTSSSSSENIAEETECRRNDMQNTQ